MSIKRAWMSVDLYQRGTCWGKFYQKKLATLHVRSAVLNTVSVTLENVNKRPNCLDVTFLFYTWMIIKGKHLFK